MIPRRASSQPAPATDDAAFRLILADDHALIREGLKLLIATRPGHAVVGEAADGATLTALLKQVPADLLVLDLGMPGLSGLSFIRDLRETHPRLKILILTANTDPQTARAAIAAGADGYIVKGSDLDELFDALDALRQGQPYLSPPLRDGHLRHSPAAAAGGIAFAAITPVPLTRRERELLVLIAGGATARAVGTRLGISPHTARKHRENLMRKLDLHSAAELAAYAVRLGLPVG